MSRWKAAGIHLAISAVAGIAVAILLLRVWYPSPWSIALGANKLLLLIEAGLALGPLLTLVVFKSGKKGMLFDLVFIATVQLAVLAYGLSLAARSRPVFVVAAVDRFVVVSAAEIDPADLAAAKAPEFRSLSWSGPRIVGTRIPDDIEARNTILFSAVAGKDIDKYPQHYVDYASIAKDVLQRAKPLSALTLSASETAKLTQAVAETGGADRLVWLPIVASKQNLVMLLDRTTGAPLRAVAVTPRD
jgi:hypothetical protein